MIIRFTVLEDILAFSVPIPTGIAFIRDSLNYLMCRFIFTCKYYVIIKNNVSLYLEIPLNTIKKKK